MKVMPLVTVAMVAYNSARFLREAVESVLSQTYQNFELIICDDCSTDSTLDVIGSFDDPRIRVRRNPYNLGEYPNRNQALSLARGEYLIFIDADDILYPHGLEIMVRLLEQVPESGMAMARPWSEKFVYPVLFSPRQFYLSGYLGQDVSGINFTQVLFRTEVLRQVGGLALEYRTGDTYIQYRVALEYPVLLISNGLAWWRRTPGQASEKVLRDYDGVLDKLKFSRNLLAHENCPLTEREIAKAFINLYGGSLRLAFYFVLWGRPRHAIRFLREARIPIYAWRYLFTPGSYPFMADVDATEPMTMSFTPDPVIEFKLS